MSKIYNISKGQLATLWIFGVLALIGVSERLNYSSSIAEESFMILIPFALIFYTIGWRNYKK